MKCPMLILTVLGLGLMLSSQAQDDKPTLSEYVDYASVLNQFVDPIMAEPLSSDRVRYERPLQAFTDKCKERVEAKEADRKLAERAYSLCRRLQEGIDTWKEKREDLKRIQSDTGLLKTSASERDKIALQEKIERKSKNLERLWEDEIKPDAASAKRHYSTIADWQDKLKAAIQDGVVVLHNAPPPPPPVAGGTVPVFRPGGGETPAPNFNPGGGTTTTTTPPAPTIPEDKPPATGYTFTMAPLQSKVADQVKTPDFMLETVKKTANWLEVQQRRANAKLASRIYADQDGPSSFLYLQVTDLFQKQDRDVRQRFAEGIQQFWAMSCKQAGHCRADRDAHLVLIDETQKVVGMSSDTDGSIIRLSF